jgi:hypothetical protein
MSAHKIDFYLDSSPGLRSLASQARQLAELQQKLLKVIPQPLAQACSVKQLRAGTLILLAGNSAIAAKLRQLAPRLLTAYQKQGSEVTSIRIEVQVKETIHSSVSIRGNRQLSIETINNLEHLALSLDASPLQQALTKLAKRQRDKY